jgi:hypothetical protein
MCTLIEGRFGAAMIAIPQGTQDLTSPVGRQGRPVEAS